jgi:hypothetical protein
MLMPKTEGAAFTRGLRTWATQCKDCAPWTPDVMTCVGLASGVASEFGTPRAPCLLAMTRVDCNGD